MELDHLNVLAAFLTIAEERSFTKASKRLGVSRSALSHSMRGLEDRLGVRLLARTTRSVAPTEAGAELISRLGPAFREVSAVLGDIVERSARPSGRVRLLVTPLSASMVLAPKLATLAARFPDVVLEVTTTQFGRSSSSPTATTPASTSASPSSATWWPCACPRPPDRGRRLACSTSPRSLRPVTQRPAQPSVHQPAGGIATSSTGGSSRRTVRAWTWTSPAPR